MAGIFISYRREDSAGHAGRLYDQLSAHFGKDKTFIDVDTIQPGEDFIEAIEGKVGACDALVALIGGNWLTCKDEDGKRRLDNPDDFVQIEVSAALKRNVRVVPVLLDGARMPRREDLPESLVPLTRRNALELSYSRFHQDVQRLIDALEKVIGAADQTRKEAEAQRLVTEQAAKAAAEEQQRHRLVLQQSEAPEPERKRYEAPPIPISVPAASGSQLLRPALAVIALLVVGLAYWILKPNAGSNSDRHDVVVPQHFKKADTRPVPSRDTPPQEEKPVPLAQTLTDGGDLRPTSDRNFKPALPRRATQTIHVDSSEKPSSPSSPRQRIRVGGNVQAANLVHQIAPVYPPLAKQARIQGTVRFTAVIGKDGTIQNLELVTGHPLLVPAAQTAVKQWLYKPTRINGEPVEVVTQIDVNFTLSQ